MAISISIVINVLIIIALGFCYISFKSDKTPSTPPPVTQSESEPEPPSEPEVVPLPGEKAKDTVNRVLEEQTQAAANRTDKENLTVLEEQGKRLQQFSSEESIDQIADQFHSWTGTEERAAEPAPDTPMQTAKTISSSNFDTSTAQFYDVKKIRSKSTGEIKYKAILLDAQGRTFSMELPQEDGERLYPVFKQMKQNPLMAKVYQKIIMPLIDKQLKDLRGEENE
ncbi:MAG: hypothetical protein IKX40_01990 [Thermoguttaceae bacterium]|nr:hypothetical protein [Thermoguttaceae bacterium]